MTMLLFSKSVKIDPARRDDQIIANDFFVPATSESYDLLDY